MKNKKGQLLNIQGLLFLFLFMGFVLAAGLIIVFISSITNFVFDTAVPEITNLGMIGSTNFTEATDASIVPLNDLVQSFTWFAGIIYIALLGGCLVIAMVISQGGLSKWLMGLFLALGILLIIVSMFVSNVYEDFYNDTDEIGTRMKEHKVLSFLVLYAPNIFTVIIFLCGIIMFSGIGRDEF